MDTLSKWKILTSKNKKTKRKWDFMLRIKDKITENNCTEFKELIEILEKIEKKS